MDNIVKTFINKDVHTQLQPAQAAKRESGAITDNTDVTVYNLMGGGQLPLIRESHRIDSTDYQYFVNQHGHDRTYAMPLYIESIDDMRNRITDYFPIMDMPQIFGLHNTATVKMTTDLADNILHQTYIYQFVVKRPKRIVLNQS